MTNKTKQKLVQFLESESIALGKEITIRIPVVRELQHDYDSQRHALEAFQSELAECKAAISELIGTSGAIRKQPHKQKRPFFWMKEIRELIAKEGRFMSLQECGEILLKQHPEQRHGWYSVKQNLPRTFLTKSPKLLEYEGKLGLQEWFLDGKPIVSKLKQFMYAS